MLDVQEKYRNLKAAKRLLNTERSEVLEPHIAAIEPHEMGIERHVVAIEYFSLPSVVSKIQTSRYARCSRKIPQFERCEATIESRVAAIEHRTK